MDAVLDLFRDHLRVVALVPEAPAIRVGSPALLEGVPVGRVTRIAFVHAGDSATLALDLRLDGRARALLRSDSRARATRQRFVGQPVIVLSAGHEGAATIRNGDTLRGRPLPSLQDILERGRRLGAATDSVLQDTSALRRLTSARAPEIRRLRDALSSLAGEAGDLVTTVREGPASEATRPGGALDRLGAVRRDLDRVIEALGAAESRYRTGGGGELGTRLMDVRRRASELDASVARLQDRFGAGAGIVGRLPRDSALFVAVQSLRASVDSLVSDAGSLAVRMFLP